MGSTHDASGLRGDLGLLCADTVLCHGDSVNKTENKTEKVLMELMFWKRKTDKTKKINKIISDSV